jgi:hypothetical protein
MFGNRQSVACFLIAYSLCGTRRAHTHCRLQIPTLRFGICKCIRALANPNIARSCNVRVRASEWGALGGAGQFLRWLFMQIRPERDRLEP